ncbi:DNA mismatch repair protein [Polaribacter vadi]|uniref:DNA mismatch repair protein n=1 Tax=Polaribacter vadi TaxID=1774273 RepID=A0A1B8TT94_9FLAO|nr:DNA mismatch repair protein [Polaribacter vadi]AOW18148.1 DNA mismatch repair protein [Polaribacter vadi]OBY62877.1 DNA mismatch repair protein [Polaribacter vadi]
MIFKVDKQTITDLKIVSDDRSSDIYELFNRTKTVGGAKILKKMFLCPISEANAITKRLHTIKYFKDTKASFPFKNETFDTIDFYLSDPDERTLLTTHGNDLQHKVCHLLGADTEFQKIHKGAVATLQFLLDLKAFIVTIEKKEETKTLQEDVQAVAKILEIPKLAFLNTIKQTSKLSYVKTAELDRLFRFTLRKDILKLLNYAFEIDVYITVAEVSNDLGFNFAEIDPSEENKIELVGVYHPLVPNAVSNNVLITEENNMVFLTGANMAGKSTFMKTFGIAIYLAHVGFPVPAKKMVFSVQNGMFTTINLADNLNMGFSHFYAEVARVKKVAEAVNENERLIIVFDELFRGTNVKDAYEATVEVVNALANKRKCTFIISTHIIEAGEDLKAIRDNIKFLYLPTKMKGKVPQYTYTIEDGITSDRHGMLIIENERILDILKAT